MTASAIPREHPSTVRVLARRWSARAAATRLLHSDAVIVDVETTDLDGRVCEIAVIDTAGRVLLDTLVNPGCPITAAAGAVHGITADEVATAPFWEEIAGTVAALLSGRVVAAYNAPFDQGVITSEMHRVAHPVTAFRAPWTCLMRARSAVESRPFRALNGGHRALGDCFSALEVLEQLAIGPSRRGRR